MNETSQFTPRKFRKFREMETPKNRYISGNRTFLYFGKGIFRT